MEFCYVRRSSLVDNITHITICSTRVYYFDRARERELGLYTVILMLIQQIDILLRFENVDILSQIVD